jgi:hypothetical protein
LWRCSSLSMVSWMKHNLDQSPTYKFAATAENPSTASVVGVVVTTEVFSNIFGTGYLTFTETYTSISTSITPTPSCYTGIGACGSQPASPTPKSTTSGSNPIIETHSATDMSTASLTIAISTTTIVSASTVTITLSSKSISWCYWGASAIMTPCSDLLATVTSNAVTTGTIATQKSAAYSMGKNNVFRPILTAVKNLFSFGFGSRINGRSCCHSTSP